MREPRASGQDSNAIIESLLDDRLDAVRDVSRADVLTYVGPIIGLAVDWIKYAVEEISDHRPNLLVILETQGGYAESAERIAGVFRHHYRTVEFLVPGHAMSAGTILVMSGNAIHMDYASVLGPIDPQIAGSSGLVPALGYLEMYDRLIEKDRKGELTTVEATYLIQNFNPAEMYQYEQERLFSVDLLKDWLVKYKFRGWRVTEDRKIKVTKAMREERAEAIAHELNNTARWHSHSRGITMEVLRRDLKLVIDDFGADPDLRDAVRDYFRLLGDYMGRQDHRVSLHTHGAYAGR